MAEVKTISILTPETELTNLVGEMFTKIGIPCKNTDNAYDLEQLTGKLLERELFLGLNTANQLDDYIPRLKRYLKSSALTSLHSNSKQKQRNPALNLCRQTLRCLKKHLKPVVVSNGYCKQTGKKIYKRYYRIEDW
jgi:hypothetical protein